MESKPNLSWPTEAKASIFLASVCASGKKAPDIFIASTVATEVGLSAGYTSKSSPFTTAKTLSLDVISIFPTLNPCLFIYFITLLNMSAEG